MRRSTACLAVAAGVLAVATFGPYAIGAGLVGLFVCQNRKPMLLVLAAMIMTVLASPTFVDGNFEGSGIVVRIVREEEHGTRALVRTNEGKILLSTSTSLLPGETIAFRGERKTPFKKRNLYGFDEARYFRTLGARAKVYTDDVTILNETLRTRLVRTVKIRLAPLGEGGDLLLHAIFGYGGAESEDVRAIGLAHLLAASGLHVLILIAIIKYILALFPISYKMRSYTTILTLFLYLVLTGFPPSLVRAWIMASLAIIAPDMGYIHRAKDGLMTAWIVILLITPYALFSPSFLMSFAATAGILWISSYFHMLGSAMATTLAAGLGVFPVTLVFFGSVPLISFVANLIAAPFFVIAFALAVIFLPFLGSLFGIWLLSIIGVPLRIFIALVHFLPNHTLYFGKADAIHVVAYGVLLWMAFSDSFGRLRLSKEGIRFLRTSMIFLILLQAAHTIFPSTVFYHVDIGQGDATVIRGRETILIDTGGEGHTHFDSGAGILFPFLRAIGTNKIDVLILTHSDADHAENAIALMDEFPVKTLVVSKHFGDDLLSEAILKTAMRKNILIQRIVTGDFYSSSIGTFKFFSPPFTGNDGSIVTHVTTKRHTILYPGDAERAAERDLARIVPKANILHAAHHGSRTSSNGFFLDRVEPQCAIISAGRKNTYGHPHKETIERLNARNVKMYRTDQSGMILVDGNESFPYTLRDRSRKNAIYAFMILAEDLVIIWGFWRYGWTTKDSLDQSIR